MPVKIRLARHGAKKRPFYRIVVANSESPRDGRFLETVGTYNPLPDPAEVKFEEERVKYWMDQGAIPTDTVESLMRSKGYFAKGTDDNAAGFLYKEPKKKAEQEA